MIEMLKTIGTIYLHRIKCVFAMRRVKKSIMEYMKGVHGLSIEIKRSRVKYEAMITEVESTLKVFEETDAVMTRIYNGINGMSDRKKMTEYILMMRENGEYLSKMKEFLMDKYGMGYEKDAEVSRVNPT